MSGAATGPTPGAVDPAGPDRSGIDDADDGLRHRPASALFVSGVLLLVVVLGTLASVGLGGVSIAPGHVLSIVLDRTVPGYSFPDATPVEQRIVWEFRLPRALLALVVGAALAVAGTVLQAVVHNPLADPYVFGISSGASVGAVAMITLGGVAAGSLEVPAAAFAGAFAATVVVFLIAQRSGRASPVRLVLAGVAVSYVLSAVTSYLVLRASTPAGGGVGPVLSWLAGSLGGAEWSDLGLPAAVVIASLAVLLCAAAPLNAFLTGDETATTLGLDVGRLRLGFFALSSLMIGTVVAVSGAIGFVGLLVPHAARRLVGSDHRAVIPVAALAGAALLVVVDIPARLLLEPSDLPVGLITALIGGPVFLLLLSRREEPV